MHLPKGIGRSSWAIEMIRTESTARVDSIDCGHAQVTRVVQASREKKPCTENRGEVVVTNH